MQLLGSNRIHMAAYHVSHCECSAFSSPARGRSQVTLQSEPLDRLCPYGVARYVLNGIHAALEGDLHCNTADLVYGTRPITSGVQELLAQHVMSTGPNVSSFDHSQAHWRGSDVAEVI